MKKIRLPFAFWFVVMIIAWLIIAFVMIIAADNWIKGLQQ